MTGGFRHIAAYRLTFSADRKISCGIGFSDGREVSDRREVSGRRAVPGRREVSGGWAVSDGFRNAVRRMRLSPVALCTTFCAVCFAVLSSLCAPAYAQETSSSMRFAPRKCFYMEYMSRPKKSSSIQELLGPVGHVKNGPYASWSTNIAYLSVTGSSKFQSSTLVKEAWKLYPATYDHYDFVLGQESRSTLKFRLSGQYTMNGLKIMSTDKVAHCYSIRIRPEVVINKAISLNEGTSSVVFSALAGPEAGTVFSLDNMELKAHFYAGITGALRIDYNIGSRFRYYLEPRLSYVPSSLKYIPRGESVSSFVIRFAAITNICAGFRISF